MATDAERDAQMRALAVFVSRALTLLLPDDREKARKVRSALSDAMFRDAMAIGADNFEKKAIIDLLQIAMPEDRD